MTQSVSKAAKGSFYQFRDAAGYISVSGPFREPALPEADANSITASAEVLSLLELLLFLNEKQHEVLAAQGSLRMGSMNEISNPMLKI
jgi:hypothetical protein